MEEVDDAQQTQEQVQHHQHEINIENQPLIHTTKPITTTTTTSTTSYIYPPSETLDFPTNIYSGIFFNSSNHTNHHHQHQQQQQQPYLEAAADASTYLPVAPGLFKSCSDGNEVADAFNYMSNNNCSSSRWPREETMSLLQIRSRLHSSFKQATHKGPLWDEVSRIMYEEHGYQRSGKKCREKFENLYKYYKKTKEAKSGKHDGKNYRFFRQLEALYGDQGEVDHHLPSQTTTISSQIMYPPNSNNQVMMVRSSTHLLGNEGQEVRSNNQLHNMVNKLPCDQSCLSLSNHNSSSHFTSSSSEENYNRSSSDQDQKKNKKKLKMKIKEFINIQMKSLVEQQQLCMEKVMETIEQKEKERVLREEKWREEAEERLEKEHKLWANERAWMKARDSALMDTLQKFTSSSAHMQQQVLPVFSASSIHPSSVTMNKKQAECSTARDPLTLYNTQESQDRWFMASNHHHHNHDGVNGFRVMMSDGNGNVNYGANLLWDGTSFGLKLNNGVHENHQN